MCNALCRIEWHLYKIKSIHKLKPVAILVLTIIIDILVVGVILWLINSYIPMQRTLKNS